MSHDEFWRLTPSEIAESAAGYNDRYEETLQLVAWHAANVINIQLDPKDRLTPSQLLGRETKTEPTRISSEEKERRLADLKERLG